MKKFVLGIAFLLFSILGFGQVHKEQLIARTTGLDTLWDATTISVMGFAQSITQNVIIPSPVLTFIEGDSIELDLWNISQGVPHTIHLHGLDVDQQNDGVPHLSFEVHHMKHGYYRFKAPHPGAYLYHCHVTSPIHVQGGMYGMIIVKPAGSKLVTWENGYTYHRDYNWLMSEVDTFWHTPAVMKHVYDTTHTNMMVPLPKYRPEFFLVNGYSENELELPEQRLSGKENEIIYLRLANVGNYANKFLFPSSLNSRIISSDGRPLPQIEISDSLEILPGERYGVLFNPTSQIVDTILLMFNNMNTGQTRSTQKVPVEIRGFLSDEIENKKVQNTSIYPNPTTGEIIVDLKGEHKEISISIRTIQGQLISTQYIGTAERIESVINGVPGLYLVEIKTDNGELASFKVLKE